MDDVQKAIAKEMKIKPHRVGKIWKVGPSCTSIVPLLISVQVNDPLEWSVNEAQKKLVFPKDESEIDKFAELLCAPVEEDLFDGVIRYYYVYLIFAVEKEENEFSPPPHPVSSILLLL